MTAAMPGQADAGWWVCDGPLPAGGQKIAGPFATQELALTVRAYVEKAEGRTDLWVDDEPAAQGARPAPGPDVCECGHYWVHHAFSDDVCAVVDCPCSRPRPEPKPAPGWHVVDNVTGRPVSQPFGAERHANALCRTMNLDAGPGGRYGVKPVPEPEPAPELAAAKPDLRTAWRLADERLALLGEILGHPGTGQVPAAVRARWHERAGLPS